MERCCIGSILATAMVGLLSIFYNQCLVALHSVACSLHTTVLQCLCVPMDALDSYIIYILILAGMK